ncbi:MAG: P-II family nitrogen regulator [Nitrospirae bacterium]|nr:P-II family nitrogen regulator [Nitrospirota bacterium]
MKKVEAVIKPFRMDSVKEALSQVGVAGMTVSEVKGYGRQKGHPEQYRGAEYQIDFMPKVKIEIACTDAEAPKIVEAITKTALTGRIGDGKVWVTDLLEIVRIRTGEKNEAAL